jgi:hypothetical protein
MEKVITKISNKWSALQWYERKYFASWFFIYLLLVITEVLVHLQLVSKLLIILPISFGIILTLYLLCLPYIVKYISNNLPFARVLRSEEEWKALKSYYHLPILFLTVIPNINKNLLGWAPLWVKALVMISWMLLITYSILFPKHTIAKNLSSQESSTIDINQAVNVLAISFVIVVLIIGGLVYYDLHK